MRKFIYLLPIILFSQTMTVYKDNIALVKEPVYWSVSAGKSEITYDQLPAGLYPESPFLTLHDATILYQRYNSNVFSGDKYFRENLGKYVYVKVHNSKVHEGTLIQATGGFVTLQTRKEIITIARTKVDYMYTKDQQTVPQLRPELAWDINSPLAGTISGDLVYLSGGFDWNAVYRFILNGNNGQLIPEAVVKNNSNVDFSNFSIKLVEGNLQKKGGRVQPVYRAEARMAAMDAPTVANEQELGDFHIYSLPERIDLNRNQSVTVRLYEPRNVDYEKTYVFENIERSKKEEPLKIEIKLSNTAENNLDIPLPQGKVSLYLLSPNGSMEYAGEDILKQVPRGETATIFAGRAFDVIGKRTVLHYDRQRKSEEASIEIIVKNIRDEAVNVRLVEQIHGDWVIRDASEDYIKKDASTIHFPISLKASDSKTVTYTYRKEWK
ncbi:MAG TPA: hypothetical protein QGF08_06900 [Candidatus Marinimicrobia bacterium]|nr:hypothetical protein [Candidatus Neomarinimicrobiota bacterium]MDP6276095.1 hypothetical protein [Candidatus Neomarinimicrobiota bacterium]MDP7217432.1 hypothetical protein [Candidatus Neomarinimicrobiota bacterium]MDP7436605.1 hypothetical protein [Candidatus Neomarinimicrobiota bacterium]HBN45301.1 hypothetical protein [Candidatus Neomarinimicrobiota bacterium]|tara:strand:+ start:10207 stop:11520 length:1314 start_codon:yes stop_codon:yes gene_type:complete